MLLGQHLLQRHFHDGTFLLAALCMIRAKAGGYPMCCGQAELHAPLTPIFFVFHQCERKLAGMSRECSIRIPGNAWMKLRCTHIGSGTVPGWDNWIRRYRMRFHIVHLLCVWLPGSFPSFHDAGIRRPGDHRPVLSAGPRNVCQMHMNVCFAPPMLGWQLTIVHVYAQTEHGGHASQDLIASMLARQHVVFCILVDCPFVQILRDCGRAKLRVSTQERVKEVAQHVCIRVASSTNTCQQHSHCVAQCIGIIRNRKGYEFQTLTCLLCLPGN